MYQVPYINNYNSQANIDRINNQINELQKMKEQLQQPIQPPTSLTQNFQLAPQNRDVIKYADSINEVQRDLIFGDTPYFAKDMSVVWVKNTKGDIKTYELKEIVPKDEKDIKIEYLQAQIEELKKGMNKDESTSNIEQSNTDASEDEQPTSISKTSKFNKKH